MESTKNKLPEKTKKFFYDLGNYLDTKLLFFGSVQRPDYVPGKSDIDVDIFTDNEYSLMNKMQHFLHVDKHDFEKVVWIIKDTTTYGYKLKYINEDKNIYAEFAIYNNKFKDIILSEHNGKSVLPFYITILLYVLKFFYYKIPLLDKKTFAYIKRLIMNGLLLDPSNFLVLDNKKRKQ
jgi:hypothetical protein